MKLPRTFDPFFSVFYIGAGVMLTVGGFESTYLSGLLARSNGAVALEVMGIVWIVVGLGILFSAFYVVRLRRSP